MKTINNGNTLPLVTHIAYNKHRLLILPRSFFVIALLRRSRFGKIERRADEKPRKNCESCQGQSLTVFGLRTPPFFWRKVTFGVLNVRPAEQLDPGNRFRTSAQRVGFFSIESGIEQNTG